MNFIPSRASAIDNLNQFVENNLFEYSRLRNFDFGTRIIDQTFLVFHLILLTALYLN